jgi:hypothetical protein
MPLNLTPRGSLLDPVARAMYATHWRSPSPSWDETSDEVRDWMRAMAWSAINAVRDMDRATLRRGRIGGLL